MNKEFFHVFYDGTFDGLLSSFFDICRLHLNVSSISIPETFTEDLFYKTITFETSTEQANRIKRGIKLRANNDILEILYKAFLSEEKNIEMEIFHYLKKLFYDDSFIGKNLVSKELAPLFKYSISVSREAHLHLGILRFHKTKEGLYIAKILPKYDILSLILKHFKLRLPSESWLIYDDKRKYGAFYDKQKILRISVPKFSLPEDLDSFKEKWQIFYNHVTIQERKNKKLMIQNLPVRYWDTLPEKRQLL